VDVYNTKIKNSERMKGLSILLRETNELLVDIQYFIEELQADNVRFPRTPKALKVLYEEMRKCYEMLDKVYEQVLGL